MFFNLLEDYKEGKEELIDIKNKLKEMTDKYDIEYSKESYYFD